MNVHMLEGVRVTIQRMPSIVDVAEAAGVSRQTVSRVVNDHPSVHPETRRRVKQAIEQLGYRRNAAAHALVSQRSMLIGVVVTNGQLFGPSGALMGIDLAARSAGYWVSVTFLRHGTRRDMESALLRFLDQGAAGVVVIAPNGATLDAVAQLAGRIPMVLVTSGWVDGLELPAIDIDQYAGASLAVKHLLELGHTRIGHIAGPQDEFQAVIRAKAWREVLCAAGLEPGPYAEGDWLPPSGYQIGVKFAERGDLPTAFFVSNDQMSFGVLRAFSEAGIRVPQDVSIVGFDNIIGSDNTIPPLTTINQEFNPLGRICLEMLVDVVDGRHPTKRSVPPEIIIRRSTASIG